MLSCLQIQGRISLIESGCGRPSRNRAAPCCVEVPNDNRDRKLTALWNTAIGIGGFRTRSRLRCLSRASVYGSWKCGPCMVRPGFGRAETQRGKIFMTCITFIALSLSQFLHSFRERARPPSFLRGIAQVLRALRLTPVGKGVREVIERRNLGSGFFPRQKTIPLVGL